MDRHYIRCGAGKPLLLVHGLGGNWRFWQTVLDDLAVERDVIAVDLPGFGETPPLAGPVTIAALADALTDFLKDHGLLGIDAVAARWGPAGAGDGPARRRARRGGLARPRRVLAGLGEAGVLPQRGPVHQAGAGPATRHARPHRQRGGAHGAAGEGGHRPWKLAPRVALDEMRTFAHAPSFDELLKNLVEGDEQQGAPRGRIPGPLVIGWGRQDHVCLPRQAARSLEKFPDARPYWFEHCGHFPQWDQPAETTRLVLAATGGQRFLDADIARHAPAYAVARPQVPQAAVVAGSVWLLAKKKRR